VVDTITLKDALAWLDAGKPMTDVVFITCDLKKRTGGERIVLKKCWKHLPLPAHEQTKLDRLHKQSPDKVKRNPNHYENSTRNLKLPNGEIRKVHIRLLRQMNGKTIL